MKKIMLVFGTRPEAIKMAPLVKELKKHDEKFQTVVCVTGQHKQMLYQVLDLFEIIPDYDLEIMKPEQDLFDITSSVLLGMRDVLKKEKPDLLLVHGDTTSSTVAALSAFYEQIPVGHVEAGLRTYDIYSPWPEEMNRQLTGRISSYHFTPTLSSKKNLLKEGIPEESIFVTGNTVIDALYYVLEKIKEDNDLEQNIKSLLKTSGYDINRIDEKRRLVLITGHRRESFGEGFYNILTALKDIVKKYPDVDYVYPMHLNPNVRKPIKEIFVDSEFSNMFFIEPLDYLPFVYIMQKSYLVLTDSGGIQEEAPGLGKPVLVMRNTTERPEALESGTVKLVGTEYDKIINELSKLIDNTEHYNNMSKANNPYGDGKASFKIIEHIINNI